MNGVLHLDEAYTLMNGVLHLDEAYTLMNGVTLGWSLYPHEW